MKQMNSENIRLVSGVVLDLPRHQKWQANNWKTKEITICKSAINRGYNIQNKP